MNVSNETMETVMNCMRSQKKSLEKQLRNE